MRDEPLTLHSGGDKEQKNTKPSKTSDPQCDKALAAPAVKAQTDPQSRRPAGAGGPSPEPAAWARFLRGEAAVGDSPAAGALLRTLCRRGGGADQGSHVPRASRVSVPLPAKKLGECGQGLALPSTRPGFGHKEGIPAAVREALVLVREAMGAGEMSPGLKRTGPPSRAARTPAESQTPPSAPDCRERRAGPASGGLTGWAQGNPSLRAGAQSQTLRTPSFSGKPERRPSLGGPQRNHGSGEERGVPASVRDRGEAGGQEGRGPDCPHLHPPGSRVKT